MIPRDHIDDIKNRYLKSDKEFVLASVSGGTETIEMNFPRLYGSFLMEFIQNADDEHSKKMKVEIADKAIRIFNNGAPFLKKDIDGLCKIGRSKK